MTKELRALKRRHLIFYLEVLDDETGHYLGHLVDLTTKGIMVISKEPIETGKAFRLRMDFPEEGGETTRLVFRAQAVWSGKDINPYFYDTGFEVLDLSPLDKVHIQRLIDQMGFND